MNPERIISAGTAAAKAREARHRVEEIRLYDAYAEPGYADPDSGIIAIGNWNEITRWDEAKRKYVSLDVTPARVAALLERIGAELEWCDEWESCEDCGKIFRITPDSYSWQQSGIIDGCGCRCAGCIDPAEHLEQLERQHRHCNAITAIDPAECDYSLVCDSFEHGFHPGQDADPELVAKLLEAAGCTRYLFNLNSVGQFDIAFSVWLHYEEAHLLDAAKRALTTGKTDGPSVSEGLRRSLADATAKMDELPSDPGVKYAQCKPDGTADARLVSPQEFIKGIGSG